MSVNERSASRGRPAFQSTGRGGVGNMRQPSQERPESGPDDFSQTRGREPVSSSNPLKLFSTGRGGAGNMRSPSRGADRKPTSTEDGVIKDYQASHMDQRFSTGRGGVGNFSRSRTREPAPRTPVAHSTGSGGVAAAGNGSVAESDGVIKDGESHSIESSSNPSITVESEPPIERHQHVENGYQSTGHGGAGKFIKETT